MTPTCFHCQHPRRIKLNLRGPRNRVPGHPFKHPLHFDHGRSWPGIESLLGFRGWTWYFVCVLDAKQGEAPADGGVGSYYYKWNSRQHRWVQETGYTHVFLLFTFFTVSLNVSIFPFPALPHPRHLHKHTVKADGPWRRRCRWTEKFRWEKRLYAGIRTILAT